MLSRYAPLTDNRDVSIIQQTLEIIGLFAALITLLIAVMVVLWKIPRTRGMVVRYRENRYREANEPVLEAVAAVEQRIETRVDERYNELRALLFHHAAHQQQLENDLDGIRGDN